MAIGLVSAATLVVALLVWALIDQGRARKASESLRLTAEKTGALPIASLRNGAQIVFFRRDASSSDTPFAMILAGETRPMSSAEIRSLWSMGRLWWYHTGETPPLGLSYYLRYLDGQYSSACSCVVGRHPEADESPESGARETDGGSR